MDGALGNDTVREWPPPIGIDVLIGIHYASILPFITLPFFLIARLIAFVLWQQSFHHPLFSRCLPLSWRGFQQASVVCTYSTLSPLPNPYPFVRRNNLVYGTGGDVPQG